MSDNSKDYSSTRITPNFLVALADDDEEARLISEAWKPRFNVINIDKDDLARVLEQGWETILA